ncbi:AMP-binding enzyme [Fusarium beomiforme]|uniref:AMP-binding enzyme n=1 Tax=Fusarium beomiforme TaxID=44412 RepID=A0A9P5AQC7_9HYPO|nr:AMP-binding enzyme [Fusarium beomiforme]
MGPFPSLGQNLADPPDLIPLQQLILDEIYGRRPIAKSRHLYICGLTAKSFPFNVVEKRIDYVSSARSRRLNILPNEGTEWDKIVAVFSLNMLFNTTLKAVRAVGMHKNHVVLLPMDADPEKQAQAKEIPTFDDLVEEGKSLPSLEHLRWHKRHGMRQVAFLSYSSGTSGLPKAVKISHHNIIAIILQYRTFNGASRKHLSISAQKVLGLLPFSHIYGLVVITQGNTYRGDQVVVLPKLDLKTVLKAMEGFRIQLLYLMPPALRLWDLRRLGRSRSCILTGRLAKDMKLTFGTPTGMAETCTVVLSTSELDIEQGSSSSLMLGMRAKIIDMEADAEITDHGKADGPWVLTGDKALIRFSVAGNEYAIVVDRIKGCARGTRGVRPYE